MAAKKTAKKSAPQKGKGKPAVKPSKPAPVVKKAAPAKKAAAVKKPAPAKSKTPAKKAAAVKKAPPAKKKVSAPSKKSAPLKKSTTPNKSAAPKKAAATPAKKPAAPAKPAAAKKPAAPAKAAPAAKAPAKTSKAPAKAAKPEPKPAAKVVVAEPKAKKPVKPEVAAPVKEAAPAPKPVAPAKVAPPKSKSSLVDFPVPPPPVRPPFVPPKAAPTADSEPVASGSNGSHSPAFVQKQRQRLLDLRDELVDAMSGMTRDTIRNAPEGSEASGSGQHQGDAGSDAYDRDFALSVLAKEQDALYEIEQALQRIKKGSYGICEMSSRKIPQARLEAIPFARLTVECQAQWEKEYGKRRFRPSNEVGFSGGNYVEDEDSETVSLDEDED